MASKPQKINMEPQNVPLERKIYVPSTNFWISAVSFRGMYTCMRHWVTGLVTCKAEQVSLRGACSFIDDQQKLWRSYGTAVKKGGKESVCLQERAEPYANSSLFKLASLLKGKGPEDFLNNLFSTALKLFAAGKAQEGRIGVLLAETRTAWLWGWTTIPTYVGFILQAMNEGAHHWTTRKLFKIKKVWHTYTREIHSFALFLAIIGRFHRIYYWR